MAHVEIDRTPEGQFKVTVETGGYVRKVRHAVFATHAEAMKHGMAKMGRGMLLDLTMMKPEQRAEHDARVARAAAFLAQMDGGTS